MDLLSAIGLKLATFVGGFIGAVVSLKFIDAGMNSWQKATTVLAGSVVAGYVTPVIVDTLGLSEKLEAGIAFLIGLFGMSLAGAIVTSIPTIIDAARKKWLGS